MSVAATMRAACVFLVVLGGCCGAQPPRPSLGEIAQEFPLQPPEVMPDFLWHQRIAATVDSRRSTFEVYVGKQGGTLSVVGLTPVGTTWLEIVQSGSDLSVRSTAPEALPFPPRLIIGDIQRCYYPLTDEPRPHAGSRSFVVGAERVEETWRGGELVTRSFRRAGASETDIEIRYADLSGPNGERSLVFVNERFGYQLEISTVDMAAQPVSTMGPPVE